MAPRLEGDKEVTREVKVYGIVKPVVMTFSANGVKVRVKGGRKCLNISWSQLIQSTSLPLDAPAKFGGDSFKFLQAQAGESPVILKSSNKVS